MPRRLLPPVIVLALLAALVPAGVGAAEPAPPPVATAATATAATWEPGEVNTTPVGGPPSGPPPAALRPDPEVVGEVAELSVPGARTFRRSDGSFVTELQAQAAQEPPAEPTTLRAVDGGLVPDRVDGEVRLPQRLGGGQVEVADDRGRRLAFALVGADPAARGQVRHGGGDGPAAVYREALPGVDVELAVGASRVKESLVLDGPGAARSFVYQVAAPGLAGEVQDDGAVVFRDAQAAPVFVVESPFMVDAAGVRSTAVAVALEPAATGLTLTYAASDAWLEAPERAWPVTVDPTTSWDVVEEDSCQFAKGIGAYAGWYEDDWVCHWGELNIGHVVDDDGQPELLGRGLLRFPVEDVITVPAQVRKAKLSLTVNTAESQAPGPAAAHLVTEDWDWYPPTWNNPHVGVAQQTPGGAFEAEAIDVNPDFGVGGVRENDFYVAEAVQRWVDGDDPNHGLLLKGVDEQNGRGWAVESANSGAPASVKPVLLVEWYPMIGLEQTTTTEDFDTGSGQSMHVNVANGNLLVVEREATIAGRAGFDLELTRTYNQLNDWSQNYDGIGPLWTHYADDATNDLHIYDERRAVAFRDPATGYNVAFSSLPGSGEWSAARRIDATLTRAGSGGTSGDWVLTWHRSGERTIWHPWGQVQRREDRNGNAIVYNYDGDYNIASITDTRGRVTTVDRSDRFGDGNFYVTGVTDPAGREHVYGYGPDLPEQLGTYTDPSGAVTTYDTIKDAADVEDLFTNAEGDQVYVTFEHTGSGRRVQTFTQVEDTATRSGPTWSFAYDDANRATTVTDPRGNPTTYRWDRKGRVVETVDANGDSQKSEYDSQSNVVTATDGLAAEAVSAFSGDGRNNLTQATLPTGASTSMAYADPNNLYAPSRTTSAQGDDTTYTYARPETWGRCRTRRRCRAAPTSPATPTAPSTSWTTRTATAPTTATTARGTSPR